MEQEPIPCCETASTFPNSHSNLSANTASASQQGHGVCAGYKTRLGQPEWLGGTHTRAKSGASRAPGSTMEPAQGTMEAEYGPPGRKKPAAEEAGFLVHPNIPTSTHPRSPQSTQGAGCPPTSAWPSLPLPWLAGSGREAVDLTPTDPHTQAKM